MSVHPWGKPAVYFGSFHQHQEHVAIHHHLLFSEWLDVHEDKASPFSSHLSQPQPCRNRVTQPRAAATPGRPSATRALLPAIRKASLHHRYLLHSPKYLQGCSSNIALICYPLHSPPGQFLLACFLSPGLRFRHRLIIPTVFSRDQVKNYILLMF